MNVKFFRRVSMACAILAVIAGTGCGGINASKSISPLDFLLPGLTQNHSRPDSIRGTNIVASPTLPANTSAPQLAARQTNQP
jgi:hypothetical protein